MLPVIRLEAALQVNPICLSEAAQSATRTIVALMPVRRNGLATSALSYGSHDDPTGRAGETYRSLPMSKNVALMLAAFMLVSLFSFDAEALPGLAGSATLFAQCHIGAGLLRIGLPPRVWSLHPQRHRVCAARGSNAARGSDAPPL